MKTPLEIPLTIGEFPMTQLPDKPSDLIRLALHDLEEVEQDDNYEVYMGHWHMPTGGVCRVCLAGAVMAKSLKAETHNILTPVSYPPTIRRKLEALGAFRAGFVSAGLSYLGRPGGCGHRWYEIPPYYEDPTAFKKALRELADVLQEKGF